MNNMQGGLRSGERLRVLIVDDSVVMRRLLSRIIEADLALELVGTARNGADALTKIAQLNPHVVTLDVEMPELDGIGALREIVKLHPHVKVVMLSSLTAVGAQITVDALLLGASDYIAKPQGDLLGSAADALAKELSGKIKQLFPLLQVINTSIPAAVLTKAKSFTASVTKQRPDVFVIGVSTGGPSALTEVLPSLPANFPLPILIVQHMPPHFTKLLAERLDKLCHIRVVEGQDGLLVEPGCAIIAPGDYHMRLVRSGLNFVVKLDQGPSENSCRPAVDVLFRSVADFYGGRSIAVILTGMGQDGLLGVQKLKEYGAPIVVQDRASSVVWGMPGAVAAAGLADAVLPLKMIIPEVLMRIGYR